VDQAPPISNSMLAHASDTLTRTQTRRLYIQTECKHAHTRRYPPAVFGRSQTQGQVPGWICWRHPPTSLCPCLRCTWRVHQGNV